jgi:hypothetical protein
MAEQQTSTYNCPTHGNFTKTTNGNVAPPSQKCPTCGKKSDKVS